MTIQQLIGFISVAQTRNFSYSALQLYITQPALSNQIRTLERELGCELFARDGKNVELTASGTAFLEEARYMVGHYENVRSVGYL